MRGVDTKPCHVSSKSVALRGPSWRGDGSVQRAQAVCETLVPRDELNRMGCEDMLCQQLSDVLFGDGRQRPTGNVERVIWERLVWR